MPNQDIQLPNLSDLISFSEAARISGFTDRHLRKLASKNELWSVKLGRNWFTTVKALNEYLAKGRRRGPKPKKIDNLPSPPCN